jgi:hypothetical protein
MKAASERDQVFFMIGLVVGGLFIFGCGWVAG